MKEIRKMNEKDLGEFIAKKREEIRNDRFNASNRDVRALRAARRDIARAMTELNERANKANLAK